MQIWATELRGGCHSLQSRLLDQQDVCFLGGERGGEPSNQVCMRTVVHLAVGGARLVDTHARL